MVDRLPADWPKCTNGTLVFLSAPLGWRYRYVIYQWTDWTRPSPAPRGDHHYAGLLLAGTRSMIHPPDVE